MNIYKQIVVNVILSHPAVEEVLVFKKDDDPKLLDLVAFKLIVVSSTELGYLEFKQYLEKISGRQVDIGRIFARISGRNLLGPEPETARVIEYRIRWE